MSVLSTGRRRYLALAGGAVVAAVAGCLGGGAEYETGSPESVVEAWLTAIGDSESVDELADAATSLYHSDVPQHEYWSGATEQAQRQRQIESAFIEPNTDFDITETTVVDEDLGADEVTIQLPQLDSETTDTIAGENAIVRADLGVPGSDTAGFSVSYLVAPTDGGWRLVAELSNQFT